MTRFSNSGLQSVVMAGCWDGSPIAYLSTLVEELHCGRLCGFWPPITLPRFGVLGLRVGIACLATIPMSLCIVCIIIYYCYLLICLFKQPIEQTIELDEGPVTGSSHAK